MTVSEAIAWVDDKKPNGYAREDKESWLREVEAMARELYGRYREAPELPEEALSLPAPYDRAYLRYLEAQIDYVNGEYGRYNNAMELFNTLWQEYARLYCRTHTPKAAASRYC